MKKKMRLPDLKKVNPFIISKWCKHFKIEVDPHKDLKGAIKALSEQMADAEKIGECDSPGCGGDSDISLPECPFCGDGTVDEEPKPVIDPTAKEEAMVKQVKPKKPAKKTAKKTASNKPAKKAASKKAPRKIQSKKVPSSTESNKPAKKAASKKAPRKVSIAKLAETAVITSALQKGIDDIRTVQLQGMMCSWELGKALLNVYEKKLYTQMTVDGKPVYDSWAAFCRKELQIVPAYGYKLMDVAAAFTKDQVTEVGVTKLTMLVRVPEEKRAELVAKAGKTPRSQVAEEVRRLAGETVRDTGRSGFKGTRGTGPQKKTPTKSEKLTVIRSEPRVNVDLFVRGTTERAMTIEDAVGIEQCANGKTVHYSFLETEEGLCLVVETRTE